MATDMDLFIQLRTMNLVTYEEYLKMDSDEAVSMLAAQHKLLDQLKAEREEQEKVQAKEQQEADRKARQAAALDEMAARYTR